MRDEKIPPRKPTQFVPAPEDESLENLPVPPPKKAEIIVTPDNGRF